MLPAEIEAKAVIPGLRAILARQLSAEHGLSQKEIASKLGITQPAVSHYLHMVRGTHAEWEENPEVRRMLKETAGAILKGASVQEVDARLDLICLHLRVHRKLCELHEELEPELDSETCHVCDQPLDLAVKTNPVAPQATRRRPAKTLDLRGLLCPEPLLRTKVQLDALKRGDVLEVLADDPAAEYDIKTWTHQASQELLAIKKEGSELRFLIQKAR